MADEFFSLDEYKINQNNRQKRKNHRDGDLYLDFISSPTHEFSAFCSLGNLMDHLAVTPTLFARIVAKGIAVCGGDIIEIDRPKVTKSQSFDYIKSPLTTKRIHSAKKIILLTRTSRSAVIKVSPDRLN